MMEKQALNHKQPLVSVLIPTKDRYEYLKGCLKSCVNIRSERIEFIVQDNTKDNKEMKSYIESLNDKRIRYFHVAEPISVMDNSDLAAAHSCGKYMCMIGDDDGVLDALLKAAEFCDNNNIDACNMYMSGFNWPDMTFEGRKAEANLFFAKKPTGEIREIDAKEELMFAITKAYGLLPTMPRVYHGLISKKVMDKIKEKTGRYFPGPSPDMANAVGVCLLASKCALICDDLIVSGYGRKSARGEGNRNQHFGNIREKPWLPKDQLEKWESEIPPIFSGETITAQSLYEALSALHREDLWKKYSYANLYALFVHNNKQGRNAFFKWASKRPIRLLKWCDGVFQHVIIRIMHGKSNPFVFREYNGIVDLEEAQRITEKLGKEIGVSDYYISTPLKPRSKRKSKNERSSKS